MAQRFVWKRRAFDLPALICLPPDYKASRADQSVQNSCVGWVELKVMNGHGLVLNNKRWKSQKALVSRHLPWGLIN